jgi:hypothetical protein
MRKEMSRTQSLKIDVLAQMGLLVALNQISSSSRDEERIGNIGLLGRSDEFNSDVKFVLVSRWNHADSVAARFDERLDHLTHATRLVGDDLCTCYG